MSQRKPKTKTDCEPPAFQRREIELDVLQAIIARASHGPLSADDCEQLVIAVNTLAFLTRELETKGTTIARLRRMLFGSSSEKTKDVLGQSKEEESQAEESKPGEQANSTEQALGDEQASNAEANSPEQDSGEQPEEGEKPQRKGHGRNGADAYPKADQVFLPHQSLQHKDRCPCCKDGKVYELETPGVLVRVRGVAPLAATVYKKQKLRCNMCGKTFTAESPEGVGDKKYDETASSMIGLFKYGCGLPFHRIAKLGDNLSIPLPASTQWDVVEEAAEKLEPVWVEMIDQGAQGDVVYIDDTTMKILELHSTLQKALADGETDRTGIFTSGIISTVNGREIVLFHTGNKHAGENLEALLKHRSEELGPPIQMCDALASNRCGEFETILASCLVHARRNFVDLVGNFPEEVEYVLTELGLVYKHDAESKQQNMTPEARLQYHQEKSKPVMERLEQWFQKQFDDKLVEPNSSLGKAIKYMQNHWKELTLFLRVAGAPLDNNIVERALKRVILHRKNSLFFKTENGARVGDIWMSLIYTAERAGENPFDYLVALQRYNELVEASPGDWMPWNYRETLERLGLPPPTSPNE